MNPSFVTAQAQLISTQIFEFVNTSFGIAHKMYESIPGSSVIYKYIRDSHQNDPIRTLLELLLVLFMAWYVFTKKDKPENKNNVVLTEAEIQALCDEWEPEKLVPELSEFQKSELENMPVISGESGPKVKLADGKERINLSCYNFLGVMNNHLIKEKAVEALRKYGVGSCGPPGFYGTLDVHMELETSLATFLGVESSIIYSQGFSTVASVIPAFSKKDDGCGMAILKGAELSRSVVKFYNHNDMKSLENVLLKIQAESAQAPLTKRFIITEGLFSNFGDIAKLPEIMALKEKFKYRLILEDSLAFGALGSSASMANSLAASGGFCAGKKEIVEHQRLSGLAYTFSASLPAILAVSALEALKILSSSPDLVKTAQENAKTIHDGLKNANISSIKIISEEISPIQHIRLAKRLATREEEEKVLQEIVEACCKDGVLVTRSKYVEGQELYLPEASVKIMSCAAHSKKETEKAVSVIRDAIRRVLKANKL